MNLTFDQIRGPLERVILIALTWAVTKGYLTPSDVSLFSAAGIAILAAAYGWWQNRPKAIVQSAAALPGTIVVTTATLAASTPETNIKSSDTNKVVTK